MIKKIILWIISFIIFISTSTIAINIYMYHTVKSQIVEDNVSLKDMDCILVLGAGVRNGQPTPMLNDRLQTGISLYKTNVCNRLLMSGDHGQKDYDEVNIMKNYAINEGISASHIFMDHAGFSTYESLYRAKEIFQADKIIIVTQKYHLYRALYIANQLGIDAVGVSADTREYAGQFMRDIREMLARTKDFITCIIKPEPTYLGEVIPVSGDGNITND